MIMRNIPVLFLMTLAAFLFPNPVLAGQLVVGKGVIAHDTIWQGEVLITGDVEIAKGATLLIMPATVVRFTRIKDFGPDKLFTDKEHHFSRTEILVRGRLMAQGSREQRILFTSAADTPKPGDWGAINFMDSLDNILEFCDFLYGQTAVHGHSAHVVISNCLFQHNGTAIGIKDLKGHPIQCVTPMLHNQISDNGGGILYGAGSTPIIAHNEITNNEFFGIYVKKGGFANVRYNNIRRNGKGVILFASKGSYLRDNNIVDNRDYNLSMLEGQIEDIVARDNWWGVAELSAIRTTILDKERDPNLGAVDASDFLTAPVVGAGAF